MEITPATASTVPGKGRRDFLFLNLVLIAPRLALSGKFVPAVRTKDGEAPDVTHPNYIQGREMFVGHKDPEQAKTAAEQIEADVLRTLTNEAEDRVQQTLRRARQARIPADENAVRMAEFKQVEAFKAELVKFRAAEAQRDTERAAKTEKKSAAA